MLCEVCKSIDFEDLCCQWSQSASDLSTVMSPETQHDGNFENLLESARKGCELCIEVEKGAWKRTARTGFHEITTHVQETLFGDTLRTRALLWPGETSER